AFADKYLAIYVGLSFAAAILIVGISAFRKTAMRRERTSLKILLFGILFLCISGGMTDLVLPMMGKASLPPLGMIINVILILFFSYLMKRFSFVSFNIDNMVTTILMGIDDGVILVDNQFNIIYTNDGFAGIVGVDSHASLMGENIKNILPISGEDSIEKNMVKEEFLIERQGKRQYLLSTFSGYYDPYGDFLAGAFTLKDITELREKQNQLEYINRNLEKIIKERTEELQYLAYHDPLTKMLNRRAVIEQIEAALSEKGKEMRHAFVFIDLNKFKEINDTFGHDVGDKVLIETADRLNTVFGDRAILSRMGGDEFLIFMKNVQDEELEQYMAELEVEFGAPLVISETAHYIRISCGISRYPVDGDTVDQLIFKADMEMYEAKRASRGEVCKDNGLLS
ncbi:MAG: sensor domain-containing diguanylate cyclase, partial [Anaerovoracaceae bacterium]